MNSTASDTGVQVSSTSGWDRARKYVDASGDISKGYYEPLCILLSLVNNTIVLRILIFSNEF